MTQELKKAANDYLVKAFNGIGGDSLPHVVQAAVAIVLTPQPTPEQELKK